MNINPIYLKDAYKIDHISQYPKGTTLLFTNFTPRKSRMPGVNHSVWFGLQYFIKRYLRTAFDDLFFDEHELDSELKYRNFMQEILGIHVNSLHIERLNTLGYLPIAIYALPEGTVVPCGVPAMVMFNTHPDFFWLPAMLETLLSCTVWGACTSATIAREYRLLLDKYAAETSDIPEFVDYQAHDFSMRGMFGVEAACISGMAHLQYFKGTDTIPALIYNHEYYDKPLHVASVPATEHSVMCAGGKENEDATYRRLITQVYPSGIVSIVSDSWDLWRVVRDTLPLLRPEIMARNGKLVIRPDSGDPVDIMCGKQFVKFDNMDDAQAWVEDATRVQADTDCEGSYNCGAILYSRCVQVGDKFFEIFFEFDYGRHDKTYYFVDTQELKEEPKEITRSLEQKGLIECLWDIFGGTINSKGYKQLDPHIGAIYGDSITLDRARAICERLKQKGFASTNVVFGIGSYSYQYNTRDTLGWAMKATYAEINGKGVNIFKDPVTDDGTKRSAKGLLKVKGVNTPDGGHTLELQQECTWDEFHATDNELKLVYEDGKIYA